MGHDFPEDFLWGASTSAHQVEGDNTGNDWWEWESSGGTEPSGKACDHYNRYPEDFRLARELGHNAHRFGVEWSRLQPGEKRWDQSEWDHYKRVLDELISLGIRPVLTLHHFTLPTWLSRKGGWLNDDIPDIFARFAGKAAGELGTRTTRWITLNEPDILALLGYLWGEWPPCRKDRKKMLSALRNMLRAHSAAYRAIKDGSPSPASVGLAKAVTAFHPCSRLSPRDRLAAFIRSRCHNHAFIRSVLKGRISVPGIPAEDLPSRDSLDFIGVNYYFRQFIRHLPLTRENSLFGEVCSTDHHAEAGPLTDMGWEIYPEGLYEVLKTLSVYKKPLIVTENGIATENDDLRTAYIREHLKQIKRALREGLDVRGYLHWSLLDNFEWAHGYSKRFGLVGVDYKTLKRTVRGSAEYYREVITDTELLRALELDEI